MKKEVKTVVDYHTDELIKDFKSMTRRGQLNSLTRKIIQWQ